MRERVSPGMAVGIVAVAVFAVVALLFGFTVVSTEEEAALTVEFDPVVYVEDNWETVKTAIRDNAVPLADVLNEIEPGPDGMIATEELKPVAEELGRITTGDAHVYRVTGSGTRHRRRHREQQGQHRHRPRRLRRTHQTPRLDRHAHPQ